MVSDSDEDDRKMKKKRLDFFLDRNIDGYAIIKEARFEVNKRAKDTVEWSGQDVLSKMDPYKVRIGVDSLNKIRVWPYKIQGTIKKARVFLRKIMNS